MELKYVVMTIVKILISVPTAMLITTKDVNGAALMGGHFDNKNSTTGAVESSLFAAPDYELYDDQEIPKDGERNTKHPSQQMDAISSSEEIPDPSPLVVPGYNLPENIFNRGKPFYLERDPLTGSINFDSKSSLSDVEDEEDEEISQYDSNSDLYDKANIDRKDTSFGSSHKSSDVNQLVPNFHDFLNLPVKYNSDKYVYPLISSSYANTKVQGNVNKQQYQNHKNYAQVVTHRTTTPSTTTTTRYTSSQAIYDAYDDYEEYQTTTKKNNIDSIYLTTSQRTMPTTTATTATTTTTTTPATTKTTTKKPLSLFQQLFGDYEETETEAAPLPPISSTTTTTTKKPSNVVSESNYYDYEYEDVPEDVKMKNDRPPETTVPSTPRPQQPTELVTATTTTPVVTTTTTTTTTTTPKPNKPFQQQQTEKVAYQTMSSTTIHVPAHQDTASFLVGNHNHHQNVVMGIGGNGGEYVGTVVVEQNDGTRNREKETPSFSGSAVTLHPFKHSEASLAIGVPVDRVKGVPGQVVDEKLETNGGEYVKNKIRFPDENKQPGPPPELKPPKLPPNREILKLNSRPVYHQLPSSLTPPKEPDFPLPSKFGASRPPWDPRPDRFFSGRPEYSRPPRPPPFDSNLAHKRIDSLPNILPQFRPNIVVHTSKRQPPPYVNNNNRPVGGPHPPVFEKLQPPPPPPKYLNALRKAVFVEQNEKALKLRPPQVVLPNRKQGVGDDEAAVETLQMIQAKQSEKQLENDDDNNKTAVNNEESKPLYVVYPVNTAPLKLDAFDTTKKETVVIGTRAELPLPPSKINLEHTDLFNAKDRNDAPILKPHIKPMKPEFPYPLEKPNPPELNNDFWNTNNVQQENRISVTLRTHTERPIAVAYSPTKAQHILTHRSDVETTRVPAQDFEAPFQASVNIDAASQGWSVVRDKSKGEAESGGVEVTTVPLATTSEFDIENFKPQLIGGFVPIYDYPDERGKNKNSDKSRER